MRAARPDGDSNEIDPIARKLSARLTLLEGDVSFSANLFPSYLSCFPFLPLLSVSVLLMGKKRVLVSYGVDVDAIAGWLGSYGGEDSPSDISRGRTP